jgi:signal transduction histidine kinase
VRLNDPRWTLSLTLLSIAPLVVIGALVVQRLSAVNEQRYDQEVVAARYAAELTADEIRDALRDHLRPWRESLTFAHGQGEAAFGAKLQRMYLTSSLVDVPQFVDEAAIRRGGVLDEPHRCEKIVATALRAALVEQGRERMGFDPEQGAFDRSLVLEDEEVRGATPLRWLHVDLDGPIAAGCGDCSQQFERIGAPIDGTTYALLTVTFPLPGGSGMRPGLFGAVVPTRPLLRDVVAPALDRWTRGHDALPRHGLRLAEHDGDLILPEDDRDAPEPLRTNEALYTAGVLGERAPWRIEVVALSGFDAARVRAENGRWTFGMVLAAIALITGALVFARSFLHQIETARLRRHLLSNVGHELKTPLSLIRLYSETLESGRAKTDEDRARFLGIIGREAKRLGHLIDNLLDVQRIEEGRKEYAFAQVRPDRVVRDTVEAYRFQLTEAGFDLRLDVDDDLPLLYLDEEAVAQALINLLDNAAKYSDTTREIRVRVARRHDAVCVSVQDRGIGIPAREQEKIFQSFYRVEKTDVHDVKGSGLGLAVVAHVARAHGGHVEVDSTPGRGSTFTLCLPIGFEPS